ncbi:DUF4003 family protein [Exiguobacterium sp. TDN 0502]|uniref:DUF4003 family protein n=1 Tax=Exiguobacterium sp. TDN 0502 TaxID=3420731 RepID=UPI003D771B3F
MYGQFCENYDESYPVLRDESSHDFHRFFALSYTIHDTVFDQTVYERLMRTIKQKTSRFSALRSRYTPLLVAHVQLNSKDPDILIEEIIVAEKRIKHRLIRDKGVRPFFALNEVLNRRQGIDAFPYMERLHATRPHLNAAKQYVVTSTLLEQHVLPEDFLARVDVSEAWLEPYMGRTSERVITAQILAAHPDPAAQQKRITAWRELLERREIMIWDRLMPILALLPSMERVDWIYVTRIVDRERARNRFSDEVNWLIAFHLLLAKSGVTRVQATLLLLAALELTKKP